MSLNPGPLTLGILNARSVRNKGPLLANIVTSNDLDFLCLTETHIRPFDTDRILHSLTGLVRYWWWGLVFIRSCYRRDKIESPFHQSFENRIMYPPGSCTCNFQEEFMSFVGFLSSTNSLYYICGDFNIHVDVPVSDGYKFMIFLDLCDEKQLVNQPTHLHGHTHSTSFYPPVNRIYIVDVKICDFISDHALVKCSITFPCQVAHIPNKVQYRRYHSWLQVWCSLPT